MADRSETGSQRGTRRYIELLDDLKDEAAKSGTLWGWQTRTARRLGISSGYLNKLTNRDRKKVSTTVMARACAELGIFPHYFLSESQPYTDFRAPTEELLREARSMISKNADDFARSLANDTLAALGAAQDSEDNLQTGLSNPERDQVILASMRMFLELSKPAGLEPPGFTKWRENSQDVSEAELAVLSLAGMAAARFGFAVNAAFYNSILITLRMLPEPELKLETPDT